MNHKVDDGNEMTLFVLPIAPHHKISLEGTGMGEDYDLLQRA